MGALRSTPKEAAADLSGGRVETNRYLTPTVDGMDAAQLNRERARRIEWGEKSRSATP